MSVGENIKSIRKRRKLTQSELASEIGISRNYLSELENDKRNVSTSTLFELSKKLNVTTNILLFGFLEPIKIDYSIPDRKLIIYFNTGFKVICSLILFVNDESDENKEFPNSPLNDISFNVYFYLEYIPEKNEVKNSLNNFTSDNENSWDIYLQHRIIDLLILIFSEPNRKIVLRNTTNLDSEYLISDLFKNPLNGVNIFDENKNLFTYVFIVRYPEYKNILKKNKNINIID